MASEEKWIELKAAGGDKIYVNFDQVAVISSRNHGKITILHTSAGEFAVEENLKYIQSKLLI